MSRVSAVVWVTLHRFPRVSGDEPLLDSREDVVDGFSPRERG